LSTRFESRSSVFIHLLFVHFKSLAGSLSPLLSALESEDPAANIQFNSKLVDPFRELRVSFCVHRTSVKPRLTSAFEELVGEQPFPGVSFPYDVFGESSDRHRAYHTRLRCASRLSQPLDAFIPPSPPWPCFMPDPPLGFCFQRIPPSSSRHGFPAPYPSCL
jgi:hypothetical protein